MTAGSEITVVVVSYNSGAYLRRCLDSLMSQVCKAAKIIVVDNHSADDSVKIARGFPGVLVVALQENAGFARANNIAIQLCSTPYIALLNPDAFATPDWLGCLHAAIERNARIASVGSLQLAADQPGRLDGMGDALHWTGLVWRRGFNCPAATASRCGPARTPHLRIFSACAAAAIYRRNALEAVGGFDEGFFCYVEDVDLGFRLRLAGFEIAEAVDAVVLHVGSAMSGGRRSDFSIYYGQRNLIWNFVKNMPGVLFWALLMPHIFVNFAMLVRYSFSGHANAVWRAKWDAIKGMPEILTVRKAIQSRRVAGVADIARSIDFSLLPRRCQ